MKRTALTHIHERLGAKLVPFAGYIMPIQYSSIRAEHVRVRSTCGVFDVSHMGEFVVTGPDREAFVDRMTVNDVKAMSIGQVNYSCMCKPDGGIVDDLLVYRFPEHVMLVVNGANIAKDWNWLNENLRGNIKLVDRSDEYSLLAVQGRHAATIVGKLTKTNLPDIKYYWFMEGEIAGARGIISRTGYTGEDGFELYVLNADAERVWNALFDVGRGLDLEPIGLGARDSLRLEMKMCLYGHDINETTNPLEAGLGWITKLDKGNFSGRDTLLKVKAAGVKRKLVGIELDGVAFPRDGYKVFAQTGDASIGEITSGTVSPTLNKAIAMAYVPVASAAIGTPLRVDCRGSLVPAHVVRTPFYQRPY